MRRTAILSLPLLLTLALAPAAGAQTQPPLIAAGVSAAGTDLSGLTVEQAGQRLYDAHAAALGRPIDVRVAGHRFGLTITRARLKFDIAKSAQRAYQAGLKAGGKRVDVPLYVTYSSARVKAFVKRVAREVRIAPRNARVRIGLHHMRRVPAHAGRALKSRPLTAAIRKALVDPRVGRVLKPGRRKLKPKVTAHMLARRYPTIVTIDRGQFTLRLFKHLRWVRSYGVAVGQPAYPTPTGLFHVLDKQVNPAWTAPNSPWAGELAGTTVQGGTAANPLKARWMGLGGGVGIHGTGEDWSIGTRASHGCIRMHVSDVVALFRRVPIGTPVLIGD